MTANTASLTDTVQVARTGNRVRVGSTDYNEIIEFLYDEAEALDNCDFDAWAEMLAEDLTYTAPLRITRTGPNRNDNIVRTMGHFDDDYKSIMGRLGRLATKSAWAEDPPSRTRRMISNVRVETTGVGGEFAVKSNLLMARSRFDDFNYTLISAERRDILRRVDNGFKIAKREIIVDQSVVGMPNFAVFL